MTGRFLKAPWMVVMRRYEDGSTGYQIVEHDITTVAVDPESYWPLGYDYQRDDDGYIMPDGNMDCSQDRVATARLIAAAPKLLAAALRVQAVLNPISGFTKRARSKDAKYIDSVRDHLRAAVAQAEGRS